MKKSPPAKSVPPTLGTIALELVEAERAFVADNRAEATRYLRRASALLSALLMEIRQ